VQNLRQLTALVILPTMLALLSNALANAGGKSDAGAEGRLNVQRIEIKVVRSVPPEVFVRVHGVVLNGCTVLGKVVQHQTGHMVTVTIPTQTRDRVCTMMARLIDETIRLEGDFAPGFYTLDVNGVVERFKF
jgi:hypothetical protein